jgi:hypothetical protein
MTHAFVHKQARVKTHTGRLVLVPGSRLVGGDWDACLPTRSGRVRSIPAR